MFFLFSSKEQKNHRKNFKKNFLKKIKINFQNKKKVQGEKKLLTNTITMCRIPGGKILKIFCNTVA